MNSPATAIPFVKASACGNDFLIIDGIHAPADLAAFSQRICERHLGIGADGVEWLFPTPDADVHARLFNADGSEAELSGNGFLEFLMNHFERNRKGVSGTHGPRNELQRFREQFFKPFQAGRALAQSNTFRVEQRLV